MSIIIATTAQALGFRDLSGMAGTYNDFDIGSATYGVRYRFNTDGTVDLLRNFSSDITPLATVIIPAALCASTWVRCTVNSGALTIGTSGVWQQLNAVRSFGRESGAPSSTYDWDFELALDSGGSNIVSLATVTGEIGEVF